MSFLTEVSAKDNIKDGIDITPQLRVKVSLSKDVLNNIIQEEDNIVFVYAIPNNGGKTPLAAVKLNVSDLPTTVILDDSKAMIQAKKLSSVKHVDLYAILSKDGSPGIKPDDLKAQVNNISVSSLEPIHLVINSDVVAEKVVSELEQKGGGMGRPGIFYEPNQKEPYTGKMLIQWPNGNNRSEAHITAGKLNGVFIEWYENGQMHKKGVYKANKKEGLHIKWHENSQIESKYNFKFDKKDGELNAWHENGQKEYEAYKINGSFEGMHIHWYEDGQLSSKYSYKNGKLHGLFRTWFEGGQIEEQVNYKKGEKDGSWVQWHENGRKKFQVHFKKGKEDGSAISWDENGTVESHVKYNNGEWVGRYK